MKKEMSFRELKELVPEAPRCKMTVKKLEDEEVLFFEEVKGAEITIYKNGYLVYTLRDDHGDAHSTVYSVHRCSQIVFKLNYSKEEHDEAWDCSALADRVTYRMIDGQLVKLHIIDEENYLDEPWWMPICVICEERIRHNQSSREDYYSAFSLDEDRENEEGEGTSENWNKALAGPDTCEEWIEKQAKQEEKNNNLKKLAEAMKSLTDIQRQTVELYFSNPGITERELGKQLGVNQSTAHRNLQAALKNLRKFF